MMSQNRQRIIRNIDRIFLLSLGVVCVLYSIYHSHFAELQIKPDFLNFPIFIGEIVLGICVLWWMIRWGLTGFPRSRAGWFLAGYLMWLAVKAGKGYIDYGPLAFRNAALFYYALFAVFVYSLAEGLSVRDRRWWPVMLMGILIVLVHGIYRYFYLPYFLLAWLCLKNFPDKRSKIFGLLVVGLAFPFQQFFPEGRAALLGIWVSLTFLSMAIIAAFLRGDRMKKWILSGIGAAALIGVFLMFTSGYTLESTMRVGRWLGEFERRDRIIQAMKKDFTRQEIDPQLYHSNREEMSRRKKTGREDPKVHTYEQRLDIAYGNITFRLFIWRDMLGEYWRVNPLTGVSFGRPLRSISIEILQMAWGEWSRDGWIMPHSVFMHIIYRAGLVGVVLIAGIFYCWGRMVYRFIRFRSLEGLLLCAILLYWLVVAAFSVTLELPYQAIPFWSLWGAAAAYSFRVKSGNLGESRRADE